LLEPEIHRLQNFAMLCLCTILSISNWDSKHNTSICNTDKLQRVSSVLSQRRLCLAGHLVRMNASPLPFLTNCLFVNFHLACALLVARSVDEMSCCCGI
jgi:hypothetical protein